MNLALFLLVCLPIFGFGIFLAVGGLVLIGEGLINDGLEVLLGFLGLVFGGGLILLSVLIYQVDDNPVETMKSESLSERKQKPDSGLSDRELIIEIGKRLEGVENGIVENRKLILKIVGDFDSKQDVLNRLDADDCTLVGDVISCEIR